MLLIIAALFLLWFIQFTVNFAMQILPINIKGLAGSIATLANWFVAWVVTMTANLLLEWNSGGLYISFSPSGTVLPMLLLLLIFILCYCLDVPLLPLL